MLRLLWTHEGAALDIEATFQILAKTESSSPIWHAREETSTSDKVKTSSCIAVFNKSTFM